MRNYMLLILALLSIFILGPIVFTVRLYQRSKRKDDDKYVYNFAKSLDYVGGALLDMTDGHTVSANSIKFNRVLRTKFINWLFQDPNHCNEAYTYEYITKAEAGVI